MDILEHTYLTSQLFAYIGNKRALLPFLKEQFEYIGREAGFSMNPADTNSRLRFYDPFAGTGSASRLARLMGMDVHANDWEDYSRIFNSAYLTEDAQSVERLFDSAGGLEQVLRELNRYGNSCSSDGLDDPESQAYISKYYAPQSTAEADISGERLFYTAENARFIDGVRWKIQNEYPGDSRESRLLIALLLYQAGTHANTSGVFKAYHKGFGGHGKDALQRILKAMELPYPRLPERELLPRDQNIRVSSSDALSISGSSYDMVYLDPPYNQHQYGSNYFMLNSIARWDKPRISTRIGADGKLTEKAGIRKDWVRTRSDFCYRDLAPDAFQQLLDSLDAPDILLSYNSEGIIPFERLLEIMSKQGRVEMLTRDYTTYRGGRQSSTRKVGNLEFILHLNRRRRMTPKAGHRIQELLLMNRLQRLSAGWFQPEILSGYFPDKQLPFLGCCELPEFFEFSRDDQARIRTLASSTRNSDNQDNPSFRELQQLVDTLEGAQIQDHAGRVKVVSGILQQKHAVLSSGVQTARIPPAQIRGYIKTLLWSLKKLGFRKYAKEFDELENQLRAGIQSGRLPDFSRELDEAVDRVRPRMR